MDTDDYLPISTIEKYAFCRRQAYLHYREREDAENRFIAEGSILHKRVMEDERESRGALQILRGHRLVSHRLRLTGIADVIEQKDGVLVPVEYKRGRGRGRTSQHVQLTLQVLCLEEMLECHIARGAIWHGGDRRRETVLIDDPLRRSAESMVIEAHRELAATRAPTAVLFSGCRACSLREICLPAAAGRSARSYLSSALEANP